MFFNQQIGAYEYKLAVFVICGWKRKSFISFDFYLFLISIIEKIYFKIATKREIK